MVKYRLNRKSQPRENQYDEFDDYEDYYAQYYEEYDEEDIELEKQQSNGVVVRTKNLYQGQIDQLKTNFQQNVSMQKRYYEEKDSRWLYHQQVQRNNEFVKKLIIITVLLGILSLLAYILIRF